MPRAPRIRVTTVAEDASVTHLELFFDLVIVFAFTMVTDFAADETTAINLLRALLILTLLWWLWIGVSWIGNSAKADEGIMRVAMFVAAGGVFVIALTIPEAYHDLPGGWYAPLVFVIAYIAARLVHLGMFWAASAGDAQLRRQVIRWASGSLSISSSLLIAGVFASGNGQIILWFAAVVGDMLWTLYSGDNWRLNSVSHFTERYGLIIIIALGESIISIGVGVAGLPISWPIVVGSLLGLAIAGLLWWAYFDIAAVAVERELRHARGERRIQIARNSYTYWHFPMIIGIIGLSIGMKKVLGYVGGSGHHSLRDALHGIPLLALYGGVAIYLIGLVGFKHYAVRKFSTQRLVTAAILVALIPVAAKLPALAALGLLCAALVVLIVGETLLYSELRRPRTPSTTTGA